MDAEVKGMSKRERVANRAVRAAVAELHAALLDLYGERAPIVVLYGSQARGDAGPESDIDLVLIYEQPVQPGREVRRISPILADLNLRYGALISILPVSQADYRAADSPFWLSVRREGIGIDAI